MNLIEKTVKALELDESECCHLYLEIREIDRTTEWVKHNPYLNELFCVLHQKFEGKSLQYMDEFEQTLKL